MKRKALALLLALALVSAAAGPAKAALIDFDELTVTEGTFDLFPADQYRPEGIVFDRPITIEDVEALDASFFNDFFLPGGGTAPNALVLSVFPRPDLEIAATFVVPGTTTPGVTDFVQLDVFDGNVGTSLGTLQVFDVNDVLIGSVSIVTPPSGHAVYSINTPGIANLRLVDDGDGALYDNLSFNTPVPEPSTWLLLVCGLAGVALARRGSQV